MVDEKESNPKHVILFGDGHWAEYVAYILDNDSKYHVVGFTVDRAYLQRSVVLRRPVVAFEDIVAEFPPSHFKLLISAGFVDQNKLRANRYQQAMRLGYSFVTYVSSRASVWPNVAMGDNITIHEGAIVQPFCRVGENTHILSGANISHHSYIGDHCFIAGGATIGGGCSIGDFCFLGMNSTIKEGVSIAPGITVGAGTTVIRDLETAGTYVGSQARLLGT